MAGPHIASDGEAGVVSSPHQNNFSMALRVEVWDGRPPDDDVWRAQLWPVAELPDDRPVKHWREPG
jgi:hypothetical protein